jgi:hypothetical protein
MKTDRVLTMDECLNGWGMVPTRVEPAGCDARHISIAEEKHVDLKRNARSCNCDRWGHPCAECLDRKKPNESRRSDFNTGREMR